MMLLSRFLSLISVLLILLCLLIPLKKSSAAAGHKIVRALLKPHRLYALLLLVLSLAHGILAQRTPAMSSGKIAWLFILLFIIISFADRRIEKRQWSKIHRRLSATGCILIAGHIITAFLF